MLRAERVRRRSLERRLDDRQRDEALGRAAARLDDLEHGAAEDAVLGLSLTPGRRGEAEGAVQRVDLGPGWDLLVPRELDEDARRQLDEDRAADRLDVLGLAEARRRWRGGGRRRERLIGPEGRPGAVRGDDADVVERPQDESRELGRDRVV